MRNIIWRHKTKERRKGKGTRNPDCSMDLSTWIIINASTKRQSRPRNIRIITAFLQVSQDTSFGLASRVVTVSIGRPRRHEQHVGNTSLYSLVLTAAHWSVPSALQHTRIDRTHQDHTDKQGILMPSMLAPSRNDNDVVVHIDEAECFIVQPDRLLALRVDTCNVSIPSCSKSLTGLRAKRVLYSQ